MYHKEINRNMWDQEFSCFKNLYVEVSSEYLPLGDIHKFIKYGDNIYPDCRPLKEQTLLARQRLAEGDKAGYDQIKRLFPAITPHAYYPGGRGKESEHELSGVMMLDFDHLDEKEMKSLLESSQKLPSVILACKSLSGEGVHILIRCTPMAEEHFGPCYKALSEYAECVLEKAPDPACKNVNRLMIVNHDPDVYYNPEALPFDFSWVIWSNNHLSDNLFFNMSNDEILSRYLDKTNGNLNLVEGNRHNEIVSLTATLNRAGFEESLVEQELCNRYEEPDFPSEEIKRIVRSIYKDNASEHGIHKKPFTPKTDKRTNGQLTSSENDIEEPDPDDVLKATCPDPATVRDYIPQEFYTYVVDPEDSPEVRFASLLALLSSLGAMMPDVCCKISRSETILPFIYSVTTGPAASGKSLIKRAAHLFMIHSSQIEGESQAECDKLAAERKAWKECMKKQAKEEDCDCGAEPQQANPIKLLLSTHTSESKLTELMANNPFYPTLLYDTELDRAMETKEFPLSPCLRQAYEGEPFSSHTHAHGSLSVKNPKLALLVSGTPAQLSRFCKNKEDGMASRILTLFLPEAPYKPITPLTPEMYHEADQKEEALRMFTLTFSNLLRQKKIAFTFNNESGDAIDGYFKKVSQRYADYGSGPLNSFLRRLRSMVIRICMILAVCDLYQKNSLTDGIHKIPARIIKSVLEWCDYLIEQHIRLLSLLPDTNVAGNGRELKYKLAFEALPCNFVLSEAAKIYEKVVDVSQKTTQRQLKNLVEKGLLSKKSQRYYKVDCPDSNESRQIDNIAPRNNTLSDHPAFS